MGMHSRIYWGAPVYGYASPCFFHGYGAPQGRRRPKPQLPAPTPGPGLKNQSSRPGFGQGVRASKSQDKHSPHPTCGGVGAMLFSRIGCPYSLAKSQHGGLIFKAWTGGGCRKLGLWSPSTLGGSVPVKKTRGGVPIYRGTPIYTGMHPHILGNPMGFCLACFSGIPGKSSFKGSLLYLSREESLGNHFLEQFHKKNKMNSHSCSVCHGLETTLLGCFFRLFETRAWNGP